MMYVCIYSVSSMSPPVGHRTSTVTTVISPTPVTASPRRTASRTVRPAAASGTKTTRLVQVNR